PPLKRKDGMADAVTSARNNGRKRAPMPTVPSGLLPASPVSRLPAPSVVLKLVSLKRNGPENAPPPSMRRYGPGRIARPPRGRRRRHFSCYLSLFEARLGASLPPGAPLCSKYLGCQLRPHPRH